MQMPDWLANLFDKDTTKPEQPKEIEIEDIPKNVLLQLEEQFYKGFNFMRLYTEAEEESPIMKWVQIGLLVAILIITLWKK